MYNIIDRKIVLALHYQHLEEILNQSTSLILKILPIIVYILLKKIHYATKLLLFLVTNILFSEK